MPRPDDTRVVVTGMGCVSVLGESPTTMVDALLAGRSGITRWRRQPTGVMSIIGGDLSTFDMQRHLGKWPADLGRRGQAILRPSSPATRMVAVSAYQALSSAGALRLDHSRSAHVLGAHNTNERYLFEQSLEFVGEPEYVDPLFSVVAYDTDVFAASSEIFGLRGPGFTVGGACASANVALITALDLLRAGRASLALVSAAAMTCSPLTLQGFGFIQAVTLDQFRERPEQASRPFDVRRDGFVPSEGAGSIVLETLRAAIERGAPIRAEILGGAITSSASRGARTDVTAQKLAIEGALCDASVGPDEVDYVNAHGTSTPLGDLNEMDALRLALGEAVHQIPINSSKSMLGHAIQAAGLLELIITVEQIERGFLHTTLNLEQVDKCFEDLNLIRDGAIRHDVRVAVTNSFGFGGVNAVVVVGRAPRGDLR